MIEIRSFAKLNLGLEIVGKRNDGYHSLKTIFQTIDLCDTLSIQMNESGRCSIRGFYPGVDWGENNTLFKVWKRFQDLLPEKTGLDITVKKEIPPGAGLGGGSGNAGALMRFLNHYFQLGFSQEEMIPWALSIGADVPFFLYGGTVLAEGIGEKLTLVNEIDDLTLVLFIPDFPVSTAMIYSRFCLTKGRDDSKIDIFLKNRDFSILENDLEPIACKLFPIIGEIKKKMMNGGCIYAQMSGSGSSVFGIAPKDRLNRIQKEIPGIRVVHPLDRIRYEEQVLGCSQAVRHRSLEPRFGGSNPPTPGFTHEK